MKSNFYIPVRKTDDHEWPDIACYGTSLKDASDKALALNAEIPQWAEHNQILRVSEFELKEIEK